MSTTDTYLIDCPTAAERLATSVRHVRNLVYRNEIPFVKIGRLVRFDVADVDAYVERQKRPAIVD